jgi:two-component system response regulator PhoP
LISADPWRLEPIALTLALADGRRLQLSDREYKLLASLMAAQGLVVSKLALHAAIFPGAEEVDLHRIDVIVSRLRQKSENSSAHRFQYEPFSARDLYWFPGISFEVQTSLLEQHWQGH